VRCVQSNPIITFLSSNFKYFFLTEKEFKFYKLLECQNNFFLFSYITSVKNKMKSMKFFVEKTTREIREMKGGKRVRFSREKGGGVVPCAWEG